MKYTTLKNYEKLFKKYLINDRSKEMIDFADGVENKVALDICCGGGRTTKEILSQNPKTILAIDHEFKMVPKELFFKEKCKFFIKDVKRGFEEILKQKYKVDVAICQQAVNYWLTEETGDLLYKIMEKNGVFVFNTFNSKPLERPQIKEYYLIEDEQSKKFIEVSWFVESDFNNVYHLQIREGMEPFFTKFKWMDKKYIEKCLKMFIVEENVFGKTSIFKCTKKG